MTTILCYYKEMKAQNIYDMKPYDMNKYVVHPSPNNKYYELPVKSNTIMSFHTRKIVKENSKCNRA